MRDENDAATHIHAVEDLHAVANVDACLWRILI